MDERMMSVTQYFYKSCDKCLAVTEHVRTTVVGRTATRCLRDSAHELSSEHWLEAQAKVAGLNQMAYSDAAVLAQI